MQERQRKAERGRRGRLTGDPQLTASYLGREKMMMQRNDERGVYKEVTKVIMTMTTSEQHTQKEKVTNFM